MNPKNASSVENFQEDTQEGMIQTNEKANEQGPTRPTCGKDVLRATQSEIPKIN
jgi:hypothetical protein